MIPNGVLVVLTCVVGSVAAKSRSCIKFACWYSSTVVHGLFWLCICDTLSFGGVALVMATVLFLYAAVVRRGCFVGA